MFKMKKSVIMLVSILVILCVTVGGTLAYLVATSAPVTNTFEALDVITDIDEDLDGNVKKDVSVVNTGTANAYIRAMVVVSWKNAAGNVYGIEPVEGENGDYTIHFASDAADSKEGKWVKSGNFYYWTEPVAPTETTGLLITSCMVNKSAPEEGYFLNVEIIASGIQSDGLSANDREPFEEAWKIDSIPQS